jgi:hypothetical protein
MVSSTARISSVWSRRRRDEKSVRSWDGDAALEGTVSSIGVILIHQHHESLMNKGGRSV